MFLQENIEKSVYFDIKRSVTSRLNLHSLHSIHGQHFANLPSNTKVQLPGFNGTAALEPDKIGSNVVIIIVGI